MVEDRETWPVSGVCMLNYRALETLRTSWSRQVFFFKCFILPTVALCFVLISWDPVSVSCVLVFICKWSTSVDFLKGPKAVTGQHCYICHFGLQGVPGLHMEALLWICSLRNKGHSDRLLRFRSRGICDSIIAVNVASTYSGLSTWPILIFSVTPLWLNLLKLLGDFNVEAVHVIDHRQYNHTRQLKKKTVKEPICNMATQGNTTTSVFNAWELQAEWLHDIFLDSF